MPTGSEKVLVTTNVDIFLGGVIWYPDATIGLPTTDKYNNQAYEQDSVTRLPSALIRTQCSDDPACTGGDATAAVRVIIVLHAEKQRFAYPTRVI